MDETNARDRMIGHYRLIDELGEGGFGRVFKAQNTALEDRVVALKMLHATHNSPEKRKRFQQEAQILSKLKHPYILPFIDLLPHEHDLYLITEYAAGGSLKDRIRRLSPHLLPIKEVDQILSQVGQALQYIHQQNIMHRDLKPENILFHAQGEALLADFGIAKIAAEVGMQKNEMLRGGTGTPRYMAPEQFRGEPTARSDQYAFACMTYQLLTGRTPFTGSTYEVMRQHAEVQPSDPRTFNPNIPDYIAEAILKALAKNSADRHVDINAFLIALRIPYSQVSVSQKDVEELLHKGNALLQAGSPDDALEKFNQAINDDPKSAKAYCGRGDALIKLGRREYDALSSYTQATIFDPESLSAYIGRGNALYLLGRSRDALEEYQKVAKDASDPALYLKIADIHIKLKDYTEALEAYDAAIRCGADPDETRKNKIALLVSLRRYPEALREYDQIIRVTSHPLAACYEKRDFLLDRIRQYDEALAITEALATYEQIITLKQGVIEVYDEEVDFLEKLVENDQNKRLAIYDSIINLVPDEIKVRVHYKKAALLEQLNRLREVPAVYDLIIELWPDHTYAHRKKLEAFNRLGWPEDTLEDGLATCDQIIERVPNDLDVLHIKRELLWKLKRFNPVVDTCNYILALDSKCHETYHRRGKAYEMLEIIHGSTRNNVLSVRLTPVPVRYLDALDNYKQASQLAPYNPDYRESLEKLLRYLKKFNQAEGASNRTQSKNPTAPRLSWLLTFLSLPFLLNAFLGAILLAVLQQLGTWMWMAVGAFCISAFGVVLISIKDKPYHLYHAKILFCPISGFAVWWLIVGFLIFRPEMSVSFLLPLVCLCVAAFVINAGVYFFIDSYEEQTVILIGRGIGKALIKTVHWFAEIHRRNAEAYRKRQEQREQQIAKEAQKALSRRSLKEDLSLEGTPTLLRSFQNSSLREDNSITKPVLPSSLRGLENSFAKQASIDKVPNIEVDPDILLENIDKIRKNRDTTKHRRQAGQLKSVRCLSCRGKGNITCPECVGTGHERIQRVGYSKRKTRLCSKCYGAKTVTCDDCQGLGKINIDLPF